MAALALLAALVLYLMTVFAYDQLQMPPKFWAESLPVKKTSWLPQRPPSSFAWVLYRNMMRTWYTLFVPATFW